MAAYDIVVLPNGTDIEPDSELMPEIAAKWRDFRLLALSTDASAFGAIHIFESLKSNQYWLGRIMNPKATHFIAIRHDLPKPVDSTQLARTLLEQTWCGSIVLLGPQIEDDNAVDGGADPFSSMTRDNSAIPSSSMDDSRPLHYHINGVYVRSEARGSGLGKALIKTLLARIRDDSKDGERRFVCTLFVDEINISAVKLYENAGFVVEDRNVYNKRSYVDDEWLGEDRTALSMVLRGP